MSLEHLLLVALTTAMPALGFALLGDAAHHLFVDGEVAAGAAADEVTRVEGGSHALGGDAPGGRAVGGPAVEHGAFEFDAFEFDAHDAFEHNAFEHNAFEHNAFEHNAFEYHRSGSERYEEHGSTSPQGFRTEGIGGDEPGSAHVRDVASYESEITDALRLAAEHFSEVADGRHITEESLERARQSGDAEIAAVAEWFLENDIVRHATDVGQGRGDIDGKISRDDIAGFQAELESGDLREILADVAQGRGRNDGNVSAGDLRALAANASVPSDIRAWATAELEEKEESSCRGIFAACRLGQINDIAGGVRDFQVGVGRGFVGAGKGLVDMGWGATKFTARLATGDRDAWRSTANAGRFVGRLATLDGEAWGQARDVGGAILDHYGSMVASCTTSFDAGACGEAVGEISFDVALTVATGGAGAGAKVTGRVAEVALRHTDDASKIVRSLRGTEHVLTRIDETASIGRLRRGRGKGDAPNANVSLIPERETVWSRLHDPDFFNESSDVILDVDAIRSYAPNGFDELLDSRLILNGEAGRLAGARTINRSSRTDGDFRYAYGQDTFRGWARADAHLADIPRGRLADELSIDLLSDVARLVESGGDAPPLERVGHALRRLQGHPHRPDELRAYTTRSQPFGPVTADEIAAIQANGARFRPLPGNRGIIEYPHASRVGPALEELLEDTRVALRDPSSNSIHVAADFIQRFAVIHPFPDSNGRIARLMGDRILAERGLPPPLRRDLSSEITVPRDQFREEIATGVSRTATALGPARAVKGLPELTTKLFANRGHTLAAAEHAGRVARIDGLPYALGPDGFVYDIAGRPYLLDAAGELAPLSQVSHMFAIRRIAMSDDPNAVLRELTESTQEAFVRIADDPDLATQVRIGSDVDAIAADNRYNVWLSEGHGDALLPLFDPDRLSNTTLFTTPGRPATLGDRALTFAMSRYEQLDLEMWHVMKGLERAGDRDGVAQIRGYREELFQRARGHLDQHRNAAGELSFDEDFARVMYEHSPLRHPSLNNAIRLDGDDTMTVWRGDVAAARFTGMWPDNVPGRPDALRIARLRQERGGTVGIWGELERIESATGATGYLSYTSDLGLLRNSSFADGIKRFDLHLEGLPAHVRTQLDLRLPEGANVDITSLRDLLRNPVGRVDGDEAAAYFTVRRQGTTLSVHAHKRAFRLEIDKDAGMPGVHTMGGSFEAEQEITVIRGTLPWRVRQTYTRDELGRVVAVAEPDAASVGATAVADDVANVLADAAE